MIFFMTLLVTGISIASPLTSTSEDDTGKPHTDEGI